MDSVCYCGPKCFPIKRSAEFSVVAFDAVANPDFSHACAFDISGFDSGDVLSRRAVAAFAADIGKLGCSEFTTVSARFLKAHGVASDTIRVGVSFPGDECPKRMCVARFFPYVVRFCVARSA